MADKTDDLVARRLRYIERQRQLGHGVNVQFEGMKPQGRGPLNRHGLPSTPVDQRIVQNWPVLSLNESPAIELDQWRLEVTGLVENPFTLTWKEFMALPQVEDTSDFHCVTSWSRLDNHWRGVKFKTLAEMAVPKDSAHWVLTTGHDNDITSGEPYTTNLPLARAIEDDVMLVHTWEGEPLPRDHGGPCRMITPRLYAWKGAKWIRRIEFLDRNKRGFWERRGYSDTAEPWFNDRYS